MTYLNFVIVYCLRQLNGERSIYSVYHILKGKKSSQSIQDAHLFQLHTFFLSLPNLSRDYFNQKINELADGHFIEMNEDSRAHLTEKGEEVINEFQSAFFPYHMNGLVYGDRGITFWRRLNLLVQVLSNTKHKETSYFPVQRNRNVQGWIKKFLRGVAHRDGLAIALFRELHGVLSVMEAEEDPSLLVYRLTGFHDYGLTEVQTADKLNLHGEEYRFRFLNLLHGVLSKIDQHKEEYAILFSVSTVSQQQRNLTISTAKTFELYNQGHSIEEISRIRKLKVNTIEDHFIEIILTQDDFDTGHFIAPGELRKAVSVMKELGTRRLKPIKERLPHLTYFQIRIAIAKAGERNESPTRT
ncbi:helix-turn-helix domain-containing protein [Bacillus sp. Marseille-Q1617]|uniref:helix-turn-helix domain-containing protein n=1 Tax=Bacillus sp. Marseille-Q1617 TaxID=2736887 RepID=UPI00158BBCD1|nr:helix-turn-helix domain-containing protein [Bacillus sp. Marseille-Q1617]